MGSEKTFKAAFETGNPAGKLAQKAVDLHDRLSFFWDKYSKQAYAELAQMYLDDPRFKAYYDKEQIGMAAFLRDAAMFYVSNSH